MYKYEFEKRKLYNYLGEDLVNLFKDNECVIAGGTITSIFNNREVNDIDVYFKSIDDLENLLEDIWDSSQWIVAQTDKALMIKYNHDKLVQFIYFDFFEKAEKIFKTFDFTVCMGAFDFEKEEFILHDDFFKHNCERLLKFNEKTAFPIVSVLRVKKYEEKGYTISKPEFIRILLSCMNMKIDSYDVIKKQLGGMYGINYDKYFKEIEKDEFSLEKVIGILENLIYDEDYFKNNDSEVGFHAEDIDEILLYIKGYNFNYFKKGQSTYKITKNGGIKEVSSKKYIPDDSEEIYGEEFFDNNCFYKFVRKDNDKYFSYFDTKFEYIIGQDAIAKSSSYMFRSSSIYTTYLANISNATYSDNKDRVLLELKGSFEDFIDANDKEITFKKCKVIREVPLNEYEKYLNK